MIPSNEFDSLYDFEPEQTSSIPLNLPQKNDDPISNINLCKQKIEEANKLGSDDEKIKSLKEIKATLLKTRQTLNNASYSDGKSLAMLRDHQNKLRGPIDRHGTHDVYPDPIRFSRILNLNKQIYEINKVINSDQYVDSIIDCCRAIDEVNQAIKNIKTPKDEDPSKSLEEAEEDIKFYKNQISVAESINAFDSRLTQLYNIKNWYLNAKKNLNLKEISIGLNSELKQSGGLGKTLSLREKIDSLYSTQKDIKRDFPENIKRLNDSIAGTEKMLKAGTFMLLKEKAVNHPTEVMTIEAISSDKQKQEYYIPKENIALSSVLQNSMKWTSRINQVDTKEYPAKVVKEFFDYLAIGFFPHFTGENVIDIIRIADRFDVPSLIQLGLNFIRENGDLDIIPSLLQIGYDMKRKEVFTNCCEKMIKDYNNNNKPNGSIIVRIQKAIINMHRVPKKNKLNPLRTVISQVILQGMETNQKELIWFAMRNGMKVRGIFDEPNLLKKELKQQASTMEKELAIVLSNQLIDELSKLSGYCSSFSKEPGEIELWSIPSNVPPLFNLSNLIPLTLNIKHEVSQEDYFKFIGDLVSQKINVNVNRPPKWKDT